MSAPRPTPQQLAWQQARLGVFFHFGINTFNDAEWSDGTLDPRTFDPTGLDVAQWVATARIAGAEYVILTAKHHDGFCLWPTATTDYSVASSPWRDGRGDVLGELAQACRDQGMRLGLYLSPWDRNAESYPDPAAYDDFYLAQLRELCSNYGELFELWFDGAGSDGREYDWGRISQLTSELQPTAMIFNMGNPTIRWVGNEDGLADDPVVYAVSDASTNNYTEGTTRFAEEVYLPPECDVSIRPGWFFHANEAPKSVEHLLAIYYRSIGLGSNLLLNLPPDAAGVIPDRDVERLREWRAELDRRFGDPLPATLTERDGHVEVDFGRPVRLDHLELCELLDLGQQVQHHRVTTAEGELVAQGHSIGSQRIHAFDEIETTALRVYLEPAGSLASAVGFLAGGGIPEMPPERQSRDAPVSVGRESRAGEAVA